MELITLFIATFIFLIGIIYVKNKDPKNFPPGPKSYLPLIGGLIKAGKEPHKYFLEIRKKWGPIFAYDLGPIRMVIINDYKILKEAMNKMEFCGKGEGKAFMTRLAEGKQHGILFNEGTVWSEQRRFALKNLRDFGFGTKSMEDLIEFEVRDLIESFLKKKGQNVVIEQEFTGAVVSSIWSILTSHRYEQDDPKMIDLYERMTNDVKMLNILYFYEWLFTVASWVPNSFIGRPVYKYIDNCKEALAFMQGHVDSHKETYVENAERDFIDRYITEINKEKDPKSNFYKKTGENNLTSILHDFFLAGTETTSTTLNWAMHLFALYPEIQQKLYEEITNVVGSRNVRLADRPLIPFAEAVMFEVQRFGCTVPGNPHVMIEDVKNFHGFDIPKGTTIFLNLYACLYDPEYWGDPENFRPARFLSNDGKVIKHEAFMPFSIGKRQCLGANLATDTMFLFICNFCQRFRITPDPSQGKIPTKIDYTSGATNIPISFPLLFHDRLDSSK